MAGDMVNMAKKSATTDADKVEPEQKLNHHQKRLVHQIENELDALGSKRIGKATSAAKKLTQYLLTRTHELPTAKKDELEKKLAKSFFGHLKAKEGDKRRKRELRKAELLEYWATHALDKISVENFPEEIKEEPLVLLSKSNQKSDRLLGFGARTLARFAKAGLFIPTNPDIQTFISHLGSDNPHLRAASREVLAAAGRRAVFGMLGVITEALGAKARCESEGTPYIMDDTAARKITGVSKVLSAMGWEKIGIDLTANTASHLAAVVGLKEAPVGARSNSALMLAGMDTNLLNAHADTGKRILEALCGTSADLRLAGGDCGDLRDNCAGAVKRLNAQGALLGELVLPEGSSKPSLRGGLITHDDLTEPHVLFVLEHTDWKSFSADAMKKAEEFLMSALRSADGGNVIAAAKISEKIGPDRTFAAKDMGFSAVGTLELLICIETVKENWSKKPESEACTNVLLALEVAYAKLRNSESYRQAHEAPGESRALETTRRFLPQKFVDRIFPEMAQKRLAK